MKVKPFSSCSVLLACVFVLFTIFHVYGQNSTSESSKIENMDYENGAGLLLPDFTKEINLPYANYAHLPKKGLTVYDSPNGKTIGKLSKFCPVGRFTDGNMRMFILPDSNENECIHILTEHLYHLSKEAYVIPYSKRDGNFVRLFSDKSLGEFWVRVDDIIEQDYRVLAWKDYFIQFKSFQIKQNYPILLKQGPYMDAALEDYPGRGKYYQVYLIGYEEAYFEGNYGYVELHVYTTNPNNPDRSIDEIDDYTFYRGWLQFIGDDGMPLVRLDLDSLPILKD